MTNAASHIKFDQLLAARGLKLSVDAYGATFEFEYRGFKCWYASKRFPGKSAFNFRLMEISQETSAAILAHVAQAKLEREYGERYN